MFLLTVAVIARPLGLQYNHYDGYPSKSWTFVIKRDYLLGIL